MNANDGFRDKDLLPGAIFCGEYLIKRKLGEGAMGTIWLIERLGLGRCERVIKRIHGRIISREVLERFAQEALALANLHHPHIVTIHNAKVTDELAFIEMEYVRGESLDKVLVSGIPMPLDWASRILDQLCDALQAIHDRGIVHRDIKPSNLMLLDGRASGREFLKILDLGVCKIKAKGRGAAHHLTNKGDFVGTPAYGSPEQWRGEEVTSKADIFSTGILLHELVTGYRPGTTGPRSSRSRAFGGGDDANLRLPTKVKQLISRCLADDPVERPEATELAAEFREAISDGETKLRPRWRRTWGLTTWLKSLIAESAPSPSHMASWPKTNVGTLK